MSQFGFFSSNFLIIKTIICSNATKPTTKEYTLTIGGDIALIVIILVDGCELWMKLILKGVHCVWGGI